MTWLESLWQDLRFGARLLVRSPGFTAVAVLSLALGIGANGAIFQLLDIVRLRALPLHDPASFIEVRIGPTQGRTGTVNGARPVFTNPIWEQLRDGNRTVTDLFAYGNVGFDLSAGGESHIVEGIFVSGGFFRGLEGRPVLGRLLTDADDVRGCGSPGAVISYPFWQHEFGGASDILTRTIRLDGAVFPIIGVTAPGFSGVEVGRRLDVFMPLCSRPLIKRAAPALDKRDYWWIAVFGRLAPGATLEQASAELAARSTALMEATLPPSYAAEDAARYRKFTLQAFDAATGVSGLRARYGASLTLLLSIAGLVLLIACANLANLMFARGSARAREIAVRLAIGASRPRVFRQLVAESLMLGSLGAATGILVAMASSRALVAVLTSSGDPWTLDLRLDWRLSAFTLALAVLTSLLFGLMPAIRATSLPPGAAMSLNTRGQTTDRGRFLVRRVLVVGQVAISLVLVVGALLLVGTLRNLATSEHGFNDRNVLVVDLDLRPAGVAPAAQLTFQQDLVSRLGALPGVVHSSPAAVVPLSGSGWNEAIIVDGKKQPGYPDANRVNADFFEALEIRLVQGRNFDSHDRLGTQLVTIVNQAFVAKYFPNGPIGRSFRLEVGPGQPDPSYEIVGVVTNTQYRDIRAEPGPIMYFPDAQEAEPAPFLTVLLRTDGDPDRLRAAVTRNVTTVHPAIVLTLGTLQAQIEDQLLRERLVASLSAGFAVLAVVLAAAGLYGLMAYSVAKRRNEIGIRVALGATRTAIVGMIVREVAILVSVGLVAGLVLSVFAAKTAASLLFGVKPTDAVVLTLGGLALAVIAAIASIVPAQRAAKLNPTSALREEA
jgi:predicted permease